jgi:hypothetical protein
MNRQARIHTTQTHARWHDIGDVSLLEAARRHAADLCSFFGPRTLPIEVRCENSPEIPPRVFQVRVDLVATVLNPRLDTDANT